MIHKALAEGRWFTLTLAEQLGNIGSEFERATRAKQSGDKKIEETALARFLELFDLTLADNRWAGRRRRELARLREESLAAIDASDPLDGLSKYYLNFAIVARAKH